MIRIEVAAWAVLVGTLSGCDSWKTCPDDKPYDDKSRGCACASRHYANTAHHCCYSHSMGACRGETTDKPEDPEHAAGLAPPTLASLEFDGLRVTTLSEITGTEILGGMPEACKTFYARWEYYNRGDAPLEAAEQGLEPMLQLAAPIVGGPHPEIGFSSIIREAGWSGLAPRSVELKRETYAGGVDPGVRFGQVAASYQLLMVGLPRYAAPVSTPAININVYGPGDCETGS